MSRTNLNSTQMSRLYNESLDFLRGDKAPKNPKRAFFLNADAAKSGHADAVLAMGWFYLNGVGTKRDIEKSKKWYRESARRREPKAMFSLGQIAYDQRDFSGALRWFTRASESGHVRSLYWLGKLYWRGHGVERDQKHAKELFHRAAGCKVPEAQRLLRFWAETHA
jgi:TPR repeat protein